MEGFARWVWRRWSHRFLAVWAVTGALIALIAVGTPGATVLALFFGMELSETLVLVAFIWVLGSGALWIGLWTVGGSMWSRIDAWVDGDRSDALGMRDIAFTAPRSLALRASLLVTPIVSVGTATMVRHFTGTSWAGFAIVVVGGAVGVQICAVLCAVSFDLMARPLREELAAELPTDAGLPDSRWGVESRLLISVGAIAWFAALLTPAVVFRLETSEARFGAAMAAATVVTLALVPGVFRVLSLRPVLRPIADLMSGTMRVGGGDYTQRLAVTSDDELGELVASFNRMQEGLQERERLHAAFGSYVDPALAERLLRQGDELFRGEQVEVTLFFVDVRDFTAYSERTSAEHAVSRLNDLFELVVPILLEYQGHANKYSGDGVLAVFGVPEELDDHADRAVAAAVEVQRRVHQRFGEELRIGIGINTGRVIAGTVGGGGKLEFTLIGDTVNVASRVEQLTKDTGDAILLTEATLEALGRPLEGLATRGAHSVKGKAEPVVVHALDPFGADRR